MFWCHLRSFEEHLERNYGITAFVRFRIEVIYSLRAYARIVEEQRGVIILFEYEYDVQYKVA